MKTGIIVQARQTSKRFPGKSITMLADKPVLAHVIERCRKVVGKPQIIVASPSGKEQLPLKVICDVYKIPFEQPLNIDENDLLGRYYSVATQYELDIIVRITADCPLIDPILIHKCITLLKTKNLDYASNIYPKRTFHTGLDVEVFTYDCLQATNVMTFDKYDMEHVTPYMQREDEVRKGCIENKNANTLENLCVDYPKDIQRLEKIIAREKRTAKNSKLWCGKDKT